MQSAGRIAAAIEVLDTVLNRHRPVSEALADWGRAHRFAGSGDRAVIGNLVYDAVRKRRSLAARMGADTARALILATAAPSLGIEPVEVIRICDGERHAPALLSDEERVGLTTDLDDSVAADIRADVPDWLLPSLERVFGSDGLVREGQALAARAPLDLRANRLKADRDKVLTALAKTGAVPTPLSPVGVRIPVVAGGRRHPNVEAEAAHGKGWFEVQDEGSQIAALMAGAGPRQQVLDLCAGAGGKTLALGAEMHNTGQIYAYDRDKGQLRPIFERLKRAGLRNVQVMDAGDEPALDDLGQRFDVVFVDAPCTGSGTWRRRPDAKWRLKPENLAARLEEQQVVLDRAASLVRPGGRIVYVTCSILAEENDDQVTAFLTRRAGFEITPYATVWDRTLGGEAPRTACDGGAGLLLTPAQHGTDGFFISVLECIDEAKSLS